MNVFRVISATGDTLAAFRRQKDADAYLAANSDWPDHPIFRAVRIDMQIQPEAQWTSPETIRDRSRH